MAKIIKQYTKFLFPFHFQKDKIRPQDIVIENKKGTKFNVFERFSQPAEGLRSGLEQLLNENGDSAKIAELFNLNVNVRKEFNLPHRKNDCLDFVCRQSSTHVYRVSIPEIKLYFFETSVGFLEIECEYQTDEIDEYIDINYFICETKSDKNKFIFHDKIWDEATKQKTIVDVEFTIKQLIERIFDNFEKASVQLKGEQIKPLIYSHVLTDEKPEQLQVLIKHLSKNYKSSYKFDENSDKATVFQPFDNSYWTASLNGAVNLSFLTGDNITDEFFTNNFYYKTKETYYFLFLNVIHQRDAVMRIMGDMGKLDRLGKNYQVMKQQLRQARIYEAEAINLKFRGFFKNPSTIEHVNDYYDTLHSAFQVGVMLDNFSTDIKNLQSICKNYVERINEREEKFKQLKTCKIEILASIFGTIVGEMTVLNSSWSLVEKVLGRSLSFFSPAILILFATLLSPVVTIALNIKKQIIKMRSLRTEIREEEEDNLVENDRARRKRNKILSRKRKDKNV